MAYLIFALSAPLSLFANLLAWALCLPLAALSVALDRDVLPWPLSLLHTADNTLDGGQKDLGWPAVTGWRLIWQRACWIARNPASGFDALLGLPRGPETIVTLVSQRGFVGSPDYRAIHRLDYRGRRYFSYRTNKLWLGWHPWGPGPDVHQLKLSIRND